MLSQKKKSIDVARYRDITVTSDGFLLAGGGCGGGPRLTDDADEMDDPDVEPLRVFCFQEACVEEAVSVDGVLFNFSGLAGPRRPLPVAFNVGIPPVIYCTYKLKQ